MISDRLVVSVEYIRKGNARTPLFFRQPAGRVKYKGCVKIRRYYTLNPAFDHTTFSLACTTCRVSEYYPATIALMSLMKNATKVGTKYQKLPGTNTNLPTKTEAVCGRLFCFQFGCDGKIWFREREKSFLNLWKFNVAKNILFLKSWKVFGKLKNSWKIIYHFLEPPFNFAGHIRI